MAVNYATLFTKLGTLIFYQKSINTSRGTTIPPIAKLILDDFNSDALPLRRAIEGIEASYRSYQSGASGAMNAAGTALGQTILETLQADAALDVRTVEGALIALVRQMTAATESVDASTAAATAAVNAGNNGDGVMVVSVKRADGKNQETAFVETIACLVTGDDTPATATITCTGDVAVDDRLSSDWPAGSGVSTAITCTSAASSLILNGDFEDFDDVPNAPDDWSISATVGTTLKSTIYEQQTITVTGPPTAGTYRINFTNTAGKAQQSIPIQYNATASDVQAALRLLTGLELVTVTSTGTTPLFTHTIIFTNVPGNVTQITITNSTTGGTYTPATTVAGSASAFIGHALEFDSDGAELTTISSRVSLEALSQYAFNLWAMADVVPAAGVMTIDLVDGIGGTVINDAAGTANSFTFTGAGLTTSFVAKNGTFRTPRVLPPIVYCRIRISTAISVGTSVFVDEAALVKMTELYPGGPSVAAFSGKTPLQKGNDQIVGDGFVITVTNDRAGEFQEWFERNFEMASKGLLVPSNSAGAETRLDSLIA